MKTRPLNTQRSAIDQKRLAENDAGRFVLPLAQNTNGWYSASVYKEKPFNWRLLVHSSQERGQLR